MAPVIRTTLFFIFALEFGIAPSIQTARDRHAKLLHLWASGKDERTDFRVAVFLERDATKRKQQISIEAQRWTSNFETVYSQGQNFPPQTERTMPSTISERSSSKIAVCAAAVLVTLIAFVITAPPASAQDSKYVGRYDDGFEEVPDQIPGPACVNVSSRSGRRRDAVFRRRACGVARRSAPLADGRHASHPHRLQRFHATKSPSCAGRNRVSYSRR